eukprot:scaffold121255_cov48-Cyclotella_meneghiniana.AAC.2
MDDNGADGAAAAAFASARQNAAAHMLEAAAAAVKKPTAADVDTAGATTNDHDNRYGNQPLKSHVSVRLIIECAPIAACLHFGTKARIVNITISCGCHKS